ncbi:MAG: hypothetical protein CFE28_07465 [Alphaproteobacteria bacterium PA2]|nr:MAG: hypothetical protein CFE28_07465 [Alphaproteobacteria bacterium PA2]
MRPWLLSSVVAFPGTKTRGIGQTGGKFQTRPLDVELWISSQPGLATNGPHMLMAKIQTMAPRVTVYMRTWNDRG